MISDKELNTTRGKAIVGAASVEEIMRVFERIDELEALLDEADESDALGTEGWRHRAGLED